MASLADPAAAGVADRFALVTGASSGIGLEISRRLSAAGAMVLLAARGEMALRQAADEVGGHALPVDVSDAGAVWRLVESVRELAGGEPDIVVNAAGAFELARIAEADIASFDRQLAVNLRGPFLVMRAVLPAMIDRGSGHVVSIGSVAGRQPFPENGAYAASKFGLRGLHAVLDAELRGTGVRATLIEPAATDTPLWDAVDFERRPGLPPRSAMLSAAAVGDAVLYAVTRPDGVDVRNMILDRS